MKKVNSLLITGVFSILTFLTFGVASAQYYYPTYQSYPYDYSGYYNNNSYYNYNGYNNGYYNNYSYNYPYNYNYNNNYNYGYNNYYQQSTLTPSTSAASSVSSNSATINGYVTVSGSSYNNTYGTAWFQYGTGYNSLSYSSNPASIYSSTSMNSNLTNLSCSTTYYYRAVTSGTNGTQYGSTLSFTTSPCYNYYYQNYLPYNYYNNYSSYYTYPQGGVQTNCSHNNRRY